MRTMLTASTEYLLNLHQRQNLPHPGGMKLLLDIVRIHAAKSNVMGLKSQSFQGCNSTNNHTSPLNCFVLVTIALARRSTEHCSNIALDVRNPTGVDTGKPTMYI